jgi:alpha-L-glutamate ligase-like protein
MASRLAEIGVLGINGRNLDYIFPHNRRRFFPLVDDKLETKKICIKAGVRTPELYALIQYQEQASHLERYLDGRDDFVIKPSQGSGGGGIMVITGKKNGNYVKASGNVVEPSSMKYHLTNILGGLYSLGGAADKAIIEYRVRSSKVFEKLTFQGVPDIRIIVFQGVPVMAMLRLPTQESDGKANLHSGGLGVGLSIRSGITTFGVQRNRGIDQHPDTGSKLVGTTIPDWREMLILAARFESMVGLGYIGVDMVIDEELGPMLLEVNARPGLAIQIANQAGLKPRLQHIQAHVSGLKTVEEKVDFAMDAFA